MKPELSTLQSVFATSYENQKINEEIELNVELFYNENKDKTDDEFWKSLSESQLMLLYNIYFQRSMFELSKSKEKSVTRIRKMVFYFLVLTLVVLGVYLIVLNN
ncbi:MAG: hypothetical protein JW717_12270 [Marinilabiliaceae bacterium]|nr:hypothetical protein [Marinilabiliaceae bacterium]